jgi:cell wall-associated NlpC family hydrolase
MNYDSIVAHARTWLGVPFRHQGRDRNGVDCAGLVICLGRDLGMFAPDFDVNGYRRAPDGTMLAECDKHLDVAPFSQAHIAVMRFSEEPQHVALLVPYRHGGVAALHALERSGKVVEHRLDATWRGRIVKTYRFRGVA